MLGSTHLLFSLLLGSFYFNYLKPDSIIAKLVFASLLLIGTSLPDIDLKLPVKHRGIFHTIWPVVIILIANFFLSQYIPFSIAALAFGYGVHIATDALTPRGVSPIWPLHKQRIRGPIRTGSMLELGIASAVLVAILVL
ncbi:MAG TPA: metal-dependent hydrolase [Candidatus Nanoarchaeia archaeon]|nr:metal-dependent hydrolase [Candidatus Nanoarchaeia archaeon]